MLCLYFCNKSVSWGWLQWHAHWLISVGGMRMGEGLILEFVGEYPKTNLCHQGLGWFPETKKMHPVDVLAWVSVVHNQLMPICCTAKNYKPTPHFKLLPQPHYLNSVRPWNSCGSRHTGPFFPSLAQAQSNGTRSELTRKTNTFTVKGIKSPFQ